MLSEIEDQRVASLLKEAQKVVMHHANVAIDDWHYYEPGMHFHGKGIFLYILGCEYVFGFVIINEFDRTIKGFDRDMEPLKSLDI